MMRVSIDLDNTIFNLNELYVDACKMYNYPYKAPTSWDMFKCYPASIAQELYNMFRTDAIYKTSLLHKDIPYILNSVYNHSNFKLFYITERAIVDESRDRKQLTDAGILCAPDRIVDVKPKIKALKDYQIELHVDDSPKIIQDCIDNHIDCLMISNDNTPYNHSMRQYVKHYPDLITALTQRGLVR